MKILIKSYVGILAIIMLNQVNAQSAKGFASLNEAKLEPFKMEVTYNKTSHLLFPSPIRYVDLGSENLIANKAEDVANVLRIKSSVRNFDEETNFSVITQDGKFYNFDVFYSSYPDTLTYDLLKLQRKNEMDYATDVLFEELKGESSTFTELLMKTLYEEPKRTVKHIGSKSYGIQFILKSLYVHEGKFYFILQINNKSNITYQIDFVNFKIVDKKNLKKTASQEKVLSPLRNYPNLESVEHQSKSSILFLLNQFILLEGQVLEVEIWEKDGGRHQKFRLENSDLMNATVVDTLKLKIK